jgi:putative hydrolase of the HAD superfamily
VTGSEPAPENDGKDGPAYQAVFFDFGGVVLTSPFDAFARYEEQNDLPAGLIRSINSTNPDGNAWARLERGQVGIDEFALLFEEEARALGHQVDGRVIVGLLAGTVRPEMVEAIRRIKSSGLVTACLTNNFRPGRSNGDVAPIRSGPEEAEVRQAMAMFDVVVESSKVGVRKPEPEFYLRALRMADVEARATIFLDDLGINLKPARAMGMTTIKVADPTLALAELQQLVGIDLLQRR